MGPIEAPRRVLAVPLSDTRRGGRDVRKRVEYILGAERQLCRLGERNTDLGIEDRLAAEESLSTVPVEPDSEAYPLNLMLFTGLPEMGWDAYWYSSAQEIADPDKALSRWLKNGVLPGSSLPGEPGPTA